MSGYLLDTNIISLFAPTAAGATDEFTVWLEEIEQQDGLYLSVVTVHEIERGIGLLESKGVTAKARALRTWLEGLIGTYGDRVLPIDIGVSLLSGALEASAGASGHQPGMADALIAGTAKAHGLILVTRNRRHFEPFGIALRVPNL